MRHRKSTKHFGRTKEHRTAMLRNLVVNLLKYERVRTTIQKAKVARQLAEKVITWGKRGDVHSRRLALAALGNCKPAVQKVFRQLAHRYADRPGGYTRIIRLPETIRLSSTDALGRRRRMYGTRLNDGAQMVWLELVDTLPLAEAKSQEAPSG